MAFSRDRKRMSVLCTDYADDSNILYIKGAPDYMLTDKNCKYLDADGEEKDLDDHAKKAIKTKQKEFARKGLRTLLMAYKKDIGDLSSYTGEKHPAHKILTNVENYTEVEANPVICGIVGILDPARPEVANSIKMC